MTAFADQIDPFMEVIVVSLMPFFVATSATLDEARGAILAALASYGARTQAELAEAAQVLALGLATLESLSEATISGTSVTTRLRLRGNANALNRSKKQCQQALTDSLGTEPAEPAATASGEPEADLGAAIRHARAMANLATNQATSQQPAATRPAVVPTPGPTTSAVTVPQMTPQRPAPEQLTTQQKNQMLWASAMGQVIGKILPGNSAAP